MRENNNILLYKKMKYSSYLQRCYYMFAACILIVDEEAVDIDDPIANFNHMLSNGSSVDATY